MALRGGWGYPWGISGTRLQLPDPHVAVDLDGEPGPLRNGMCSPIRAEMRGSRNRRTRESVTACGSSDQPPTPHTRPAPEWSRCPAPGRSRCRSRDCPCPLGELAAERGDQPRRHLVSLRRHADAEGPRVLVAGQHVEAEARHGSAPRSSSPGERAAEPTEPGCGMDRAQAESLGGRKLALLDLRSRSRRGINRRG